ncbi:putative Trimethylamine methyltransferase [Desulfamplus magnetovallimortis]|uniref:Putative Trimethylamine methyltransferase n=1 Tax=Desulfamplus magnetovallimortis TaxID=1246637 RepID=A0A1W1HB54_9BACT|nr:trimethylamine methyltransferase family protein [Desulfamplus magnetovallimortis]SLM29608.1 putative Trimethylamine methyltransferase [Desulfamplus magnetovallimortis]
MSMLSVTPSLNLLNKDQIERIHHDSLEILATTGIRVDSPKAVALFKKFSCRVENKSQVFPEKELIEWAIKKAPSSVDIYSRTGQKSFTLGPGITKEQQNQTRFGIGVTNLHYQDPITDKTTPFTLDHMEIATRLGDALEEFDVISTPGIARDLPPESADLHAGLAMMANTKKPLVLLVSESNCFEPLLEMFETLHGELNKKPFVIPYFNPITPLVINQETSDKIMATAIRGMPFIYNNYGMSGATAPITPGATLTLLNAELLAGILFSQIVKEKTPVIAGSLPAGFDMKKMMSLYTPHTMLINLGCAEMMHHYGIPHSGTSGSGPGWGPDLLAGNCFWMNHLTSIMGKVGLCPFVGGNFDSMAFSPGAVVYANEVIRMSRIFAAGFSIDNKDVPLDEIKSIGSAGNFLMAPSTGKRFREFRLESPIWESLTLDEWQEKEMPKSGKILRKYTDDLIKKALPPDDHDEIMEKGRLFITGRF